MSSEPKPKHPAPIEDRRRHPRRKVDDLAYVACGSDNGGILLDVGEGGLSFQGIAALTKGTVLAVRFVLPGQTSAIEATGEVVWSTESLRGGGVRFVNLNSSARQQIKQWVSAGAVSLDRKTQPPPEPGAWVGADSEPVAMEGLFIIPATPASETDAPRSSNLPAWSREPASGRPQSPRAMVTEGLRRIHPVGGAPQDVPSEKFEVSRPPVAEPAQGVVLTGVPEKTSQITLYLLGAALGATIIVAVVLIGFRTQTDAGAGAGKGTALPQQPADEASRNFQVEVLDIHNRRLILSDTPATVSAGSDAVGGQKDVARTFAAANPAKSLAASPPPDREVATPQRNLQDLSLKAPSQLNRTSNPAEPQEPAAASVVSPVASLGVPFVVNESPSQPAPPQAPGVIASPRSGLQPAVLIKRVEPTYSAVARQSRASGVVQVRATIGTDGVPRTLRFVSGDARLAAPAIQAISLWRYRPALLDGQAIETEILVQVEFRLQ